MNALTGTWGLIRLILRRDRVLLPLWVLVCAIFPLLYTSGTDEIYPTPEGLRQYYDSMVGNPAMVATLGQVFGDTLGAIIAWRSGTIVVIIAIITVLTVVRHTRTEEDAGRRELVGSAAVGRHAALAAAVVVAGGANVVLAAIVVLTLAGYGLPATGALAFGIAVAACGLVFAAVGGLAAQLTAGAGAARGIGIAAVGLAFALRAAGDAGGPSSDVSWLAWLSPFGWAQRVRPFAGEQWWVLAPLLALFVVLTGAAVAFNARRDLGAGVLPVRLGPATAAAGLRTPLALAWRLHRGALLGWTAGYAALGLVTGAAAQSVDSLVENNPEMRDIIARLGGTAALARLTDTYLAAALGLFALGASGFAIQAALRMRTEETSNRAEPILATAVGRPRLLAAHVLFALLGPAAALAAMGVTVGLVAGAGSPGGIGGRIGDTLAGAAVQLPAVWVLAGLAVALFGMLPRFAAAFAWGALGVCVFLGFVGQLLRLDQRVLDIAPFTHVPKLPGGELTLAPLLWLTAIAVALAAAGFTAFRRRDIPVS